MRTAPLCRLLGASLFGLCMAGAAAAQTAAPAGRTVYDAAFFRVFSPGNALDIVQRTPGFTLDIGSQDVRGFSQAAGNVVINGARPSSKNATLDIILARIPASRVLRVEIGSGDQFGAEYAGRPQVLNLVLNSTSGLAGTLDAAVHRDFSGRVTPTGSVSGLLRRGRSTFNLALAYDNRHFPEQGPDVVNALPSETLVEFREKYNNIANHTLSAAGSWEFAGGDNRTAHANFRIAHDQFVLGQRNDVFPVGGTVRDDRLDQNYLTHDLELGGDVTRPLLGGGLKLIGLATRRDRFTVDTSFTRVQSQVTGGLVQYVHERRSESLSRLVWSRPDLLGWSVETGLEGAINRLDSNVDLSSVDADGALTRIILPVDQARVVEYRGEAYANAGRALAPNLRMDLGLTYETSHLIVRGDATADRRLQFLKPKAAFDWRPGGGWHAQLSIARTVAQLDFGDFVSGAELANSRINGGNPDLLPQRAWETLATLEHPIMRTGVAKLELGYNRISLVQDRVPTPEGFDAPGNLGSGTLAFVRGTFDTPLARLGIRGGRLTIHGTLQSTSVEDPYTHRMRRFSGFPIWQLDGNFRQDLGRFAWGVSYTGRPATTFYRLDELDTLHGIEPLVSAFAEYRPSPKTTITFNVDNVFNVAAVRLRTFYAPDRFTPDPNLSEYRYRNAHVDLSLRLRQSFG